MKSFHVNYSWPHPPSPWPSISCESLTIQVTTAPGLDWAQVCCATLRRKGPTPRPSTIIHSDIAVTGDGPKMDKTTRKVGGAWGRLGGWLKVVEIACCWRRKIQYQLGQKRGFLHLSQYIPWGWLLTFVSLFCRVLLSVAVDAFFWFFPYILAWEVLNTVFNPLSVLRYVLDTTHLGLSARFAAPWARDLAKATTGCSLTFLPKKLINMWLWILVTPKMADK